MDDKRMNKMGVTDHRASKIVSGTFVGPFSGRHTGEGRNPLSSRHSGEGRNPEVEDTKRTKKPELRALRALRGA